MITIIIISQKYMVSVVITIKDKDNINKEKERKERKKKFEKKSQRQDKKMEKALEDRAHSATNNIKCPVWIKKDLPTGTFKPVATRR